MTAAHDEETPVICLGGCGRLLTSRISKERQHGPDCWRKLHGRTARRRRATTPAAQPGPGQAELPLPDQLTIWSP